MNALSFTKLRIRVLACLRFKGTGFEMRSPDLLMVASGGRKDKKLKISEECCEETEKGITKGCDVEPIGIEDIRNNPGKLDSMNVKELRTLAKSVGISTRGTKQDIMSSLKCLSVEGKTTILKSMEMPSFVIGNDTFQKDAQNWSSEPIPQDQNAILDISENKQKRTRKRGIGVSITDGDDSRGKSQSCSQKQVSSKFQSCLKVSTPLSLAADTNEPWTWLAHKKPHKEWIPYNPKTMRPPPLNKDMNSVKLVSWNVNGLRALLKQESFYALQHEDFDVLCLQETKLQEKDVDAIKKTLIDGYDNSFWACSVSKLGYSGTSIISRKKPISVNYGLGSMEYDTEGRIVTVEFDSFYLINGYVPNSGDGLRRLAYRVEQWDPALSNYMKELEKLKPVILTGDLNCAHEEIDIYDPVGNRRSAGFTNEERESFQKNFLSRGFIDTFRRQHPGVVAYTYWGYRHGGRKLNKGWRLDYFLASEIIADKVYDSYILPYVSGSDHCPIGLVLKI